jgi:hypothetical protein
MVTALKIARISRNRREEQQRRNQMVFTIENLRRGIREEDSSGRGRLKLGWSYLRVLSPRSSLEIDSDDSLERGGPGGGGGGVSAVKRSFGDPHKFSDFTKTLLQRSQLLPAYAHEHTGSSCWQIKQHTGENARAGGSDRWRLLD